MAVNPPSDVRNYDGPVGPWKSWEYPAMSSPAGESYAELDSGEDLVIPGGFCVAIEHAMSLPVDSVVVVRPYKSTATVSYTFTVSGWVGPLGEPGVCEAIIFATTHIDDAAKLVLAYL